MTDRNPYHPDGIWPTPESYTRTDEEVDPDSDDTRTREHLLAEEERLRKLEESLRAHLSRTINRAEKAEQERDEARATAYNWEATGEEWEKRAVRAESRPLTSDAITDEMVDRALCAEDRRDASPVEGWAVSRRDRMRSALTAALTEPTRPEGAVSLADDMEDCLRDVKLEDVGLDGLADRLAALGWTKAES